MILRKTTIAIFALTIIAIVSPTLTNAQTQDIIENIIPNTAEAGTSGLTITINLKDLDTPPLPPSQVVPTNIMIGNMEGENITRDTLVLTAIFDFPTEESNGLKDLILTFPGPNNQRIEFNKSGIFEIIGDDDPVDPIDPINPANPIDVSTDSCSYMIVDTGQETCYNNSQSINAPAIGEAFYGQDAQFANVQHSYKDNVNGTVTDLNTGLMWQQNLPDVKLPWSECVTYADTSTLAGYSDWRLPSIKEIYSLMLFSGVTGMSEGNSVPYIDTNYFDFRFGGVIDESERFIDAQYAASTIYKGTTMNGNETMFGLNLVDGRIKGYPTHKNFEIRMVRGRTDYGINKFVDNNDNTISDNATGLMWDKTGSSEGMNWETSLAYAQEKNSEKYLGYDDWRLPNAKELHSIVDYDRSPTETNSAAISSIFDIATITDEKGENNYPCYWTSTTHYDGPSPSKAVYISFGEALGYMNGSWIDVHGAGAQRSDPKDGDPADYPEGHGPQGDAIRIFNYVRLVRTFSISDTTVIDTTDDNEVTLFAPMGNDVTYLINNNGDVVNQWTSSGSPGLSAYLLNDKSLLRTVSVGKNGNSIFGKIGGAGGKVERYNWDGEKIWEFEYNSDTYLLHHDIEYLPNGNILMIVWESKTEAEAIEAGRNSNLLTDGELWPDKIIEIKPDGTSGGTIVWEWHVWDHLIQDHDATKNNYGVVSDYPGKIDINFINDQSKADWNHINAIDYNPELDQIMLTPRNFSEIWIINHGTSTEEATGEAGDLLYRWGNPQTYGRGTSADQMLFVPHNGQWVESGNPGAGDVLIFNNGQGRSDGNYSSIDQFTPPLNNDEKYTIATDNSFEPSELTWTYQSNPKTDFYANHISGAQRLPDGNTLICNGITGRFFEVTSECEQIWEYNNPYSFTDPQGNVNNSVFRTQRYYLDELDDNNTNIDLGNNNIESLPSKFTLEQNYPNPFNPSTSIQFSIPCQTKVELNIYNIMGKKVRTLVNSTYSTGNYNTVWDGTNDNGISVSSGIYFYQIISDNQKIINKMSFMK